MKKTIILLGMLNLGFAYAQQGKIGVNTDTPQETLDVKGTLKVQELPKEGEKIYGDIATTDLSKSRNSFTPAKTVVSDENGVLGVVEHIVESGTDTKTALQWNDTNKKWEAVAPVVGIDENDEAWKKQGTNDRVANTDDNVNIYRNTSVGIGDFSTSGVGAPFHIRKANDSHGAVLQNLQVTDIQHTNVRLTAMFQFLDSRGRNAGNQSVDGRYGMIGDTYGDDKVFEFRAEKGYTTRLSSYVTNNRSETSYIDLYGIGVNPSGNDNIKIKFNTGAPTSLSVTSVSKKGNWYFGAEGSNKLPDQKIVVNGGLRFAGNIHQGLTHNKVATVDEQNPGTMYYNNGHFFGVVGGTTNNWRQLDNVDYEGGNGITVTDKQDSPNTKTISLPVGEDGKILKWDIGIGAWTAQTPTDINTNIYTNDGTISTNRTISLDNSSITWDGGNGFNIRKNGEVLSLKSDTSQANHVSFYRGDVRKGYFGFASASSKDITLKNEDTGKIVLDNETRITNIPDHNNATYVLVQGANGLVSKKAISSLTATSSEPWFIPGGTTQATNIDNTNTGKMYYKGVIGIGDFSGNTNITLKTNMSEAEKNTQKLVVNGAVLAGNFRGVNGVNAFPDYVFQKYYTGTSSVKADYTFKSLSQVEDFVKTNGHLPGYKSAEAIKAQGYIDVMETQISNVEKIEELYLHTIEQEKALKEKDAKIKSLEERLERLEKLIK